MIGTFALWSLAAQWPSDARALAAWHTERTATDVVSAPRADEWRERLFVYQVAGAEAEAWAAAEALARLAPGDADADRYVVSLSLGDPGRWEAGLALADSWLARHPERAQAERAGVERARAELERRVEARRGARAQQAARAWVPFAAGGMVLAFAAFALRRPR